MWRVYFLPSCPCTHWLPLAVGPSGHPDRSGAQIYHRSQTYHRLNSSKMTASDWRLAPLPRLGGRWTVMGFGVLFYVQIKAVLMHLRVLAEHKLMFPCVRPCEQYTPTRLCMCACSAWQRVGCGLLELVGWSEPAVFVLAALVNSFSVLTHAGLQQNRLR